SSDSSVLWRRSAKSSASWWSRKASKRSASGTPSSRTAATSCRASCSGGRWRPTPRWPRTRSGPPPVGPADRDEPRVLRACRILGIVAVVALAIVTVTPLSAWLAVGYGAQPRLGPADAVVALGGGLDEGALGAPSLQRTIEGIRLVRRGLAPLILFTGEPSEPETRARLAQELGVPSAAILTATANTTHGEALAPAAV